jgi:hypothetical protein
VESLGNLSVLAKLVQFCTLIAHVPVYAKLAQLVQELSDAIHKFSKGIQ